MIKKRKRKKKKGLTAYRKKEPRDQTVGFESMSNVTFRKRKAGD